jgi:hypothetical protein
MARIASKVDLNHSTIVDALRASGVSVQSLAEVGGGCPDLLCAVNGLNFLIEVKSGNELLNAKQKTWHREWRGTAHLARTVTEAICIADYYRTKKFAL